MNPLATTEIGVIFYPETVDQYTGLRDMAQALRSDGFRVDEGYDADRKTPKFEVYAHGNTVADYLSFLMPAKV